MSTQKANPLQIHALPIGPTAKNALAKVNVTHLSEILEVARRANVRPSHLLLRMTPGFGQGSLEDLFDALLGIAVEACNQPASQDPDQAAALQLVNTMLRSTTGGIGGRDQAKLLAEIAFDFVEAVRSEAHRRSPRETQSAT